jgi:acyl-CoA synthetase (AMP-forming)/AMP-acid ligase II
VTVNIRVPTPADLALSYRADTFWDDSGLKDGLETIAETDPWRLAAADHSESVSYEHLRTRVECAIAALRSRGAVPGDAVILVAPNTVSAAVAFAALLRCAFVVVALDRRCGAADVAHAIAATKARMAAAPEGLVGSLRLDEHPIDVVGLQEIQSSPTTDGDWVEPEKPHARIVLFTSGTTSKPEGVVHTLHTFGAGVRNLASAFGWRQGDAPFPSSPLASITGLSQLQLALSGHHIVLDDDVELTRSLELLERHHATVLGGALVLLDMLFSEYARPGKKQSSLSVVALGGTMIPRALLELPSRHSRSGLCGYTDLQRSRRTRPPFWTIRSGREWWTRGYHSTEERSPSTPRRTRLNSWCADRTCFRVIWTNRTMTTHSKLAGFEPVTWPRSQADGCPSAAASRRSLPGKE